MKWNWNPLCVLHIYLNRIW